MSKKNLLKTLDMASYTSMIIAALLVVVFEFTSTLVVFRLSIVLFAAAFLILCVLNAMKLYFMKSETKENDELLVDKTKEKKAWLITKLVLSACCFVLMIVFLCLF